MTKPRLASELARRSGACARKKRFATRKQALTAIFGEYARSEQVPDLEAYKCAQGCHGWHITSQVSNKSEGRDTTPDPRSTRVG